jgi:hypothetical protein
MIYYDKLKASFLRSEVIPKEQLEDYGIDVGEDGSGMERKKARRQWRGGCGKV